MPRKKGHVCVRSGYASESGHHGCMNCGEKIKKCQSSEYGNAQHRFGPWRVKYKSASGNPVIWRQCEYCNIRDNPAAVVREELKGHEHKPAGKIVSLDGSGNWSWCACGVLTATQAPGGNLPFVIEAECGGEGYPYCDIKRHKGKGKLRAGQWTISDNEFFIKCPREKCGKINNITTHVMDDGDSICVICTHCDAHYFADLLGLRSGEIDLAETAADDKVNG